jgi:hypothetical protein
MGTAPLENDGTYICFLRLMGGDACVRCCSAMVLLMKKLRVTRSVLLQYIVLEGIGLPQTTFVCVKW